jgi:hypothetical protein
MYGVAEQGLTVKKDIKIGYPIPKRSTVVSTLPVDWFKFKDIRRIDGQGNGNFSFKLFFRQSKVDFVRTGLQAYSLFKATY